MTTAITRLPRATFLTRTPPLFYLLLLTVLIRIAALLVFDEYFAFDQTGIIHGSSSFDVYARNLLSTGVYGLTPGVPDAILPPGYSLALAAVYGVFGRGWLQVGVFHIALDCLTITVVYLLGGRWFGRRGVWVGLLAGLFTACYPYLIFQNLTLIDTPLFMALLYSWLWLMVLLRDRPRFDRTALLLTLVGGLLLGYAALIRPVVAVLAIFLFPYFLFRRTFAQSLLRLARVALISVLVLVPWIVRNFSVYGQFVPLSVTGGGTLVQGFHPQTLEYLRAGYDVQWLGDPVEGLPPNSPEADRVQVVRAIAFIQNNSDQLPELVWQKFLAYWSIEIFPRANPTISPSGEVEIVTLAEDDPVNAYSGGLLDQVGRPVHVIYFGGLLLLALVGVVVNRHTWRDTSLILFAQLSMTLVYLIFHPSTRYRVPTDPLLFLFSAAALIWLWGQFRRLNPALAP